MLPSQPIELSYGQWKKISLAGQNGTAWMNEVGNDGSSRVMIAHTESVQTAGTPLGDNIPWASAVNLNKNVGYQLSEDGIVSPVFSADNANDIYYATLLDVGEDCKIIVDFT
jgi:hypothetical protein